MVILCSAFFCLRTNCEYARWNRDVKTKLKAMLQYRCMALQAATAKSHEMMVEENHFTSYQNAKNFPQSMNLQLGSDDMTITASRDDNILVSYVHHFSNTSPLVDTTKASSTTSTVMIQQDCDESAPIPEYVKENDFVALLANELNQMSLEERERTYEEIHGVDQILEETPELVAQSLLEMEMALDRIQLKPAYLMAFQNDPEYITNHKLRLMMLRSTNFEPEAAAQKLVEFLQGKLDLFGPQTLTRPVYLSDLDTDDLACLKSGAYQLLPGRDSAGRVILVDFHLIVEKCYKYPRNLVSPHGHKTIRDRVTC